MRISPGHWFRFLSHRMLLVGFFLFCLLLTLPAWGQVPQHPHNNHETTIAQPPAHTQPTGGTDPDHTDHVMGHSKHTASKDGTQTEHIHPTTDQANSDTVGLNEKLGDHLPLELAFRDETGQQITLASLVTKPTVIAPIYYRCPNVCHFLQGDLARVLPQLKLKPGDDFQVISISFDETETPELATRSRSTYMAAMDNAIKPEGWRFLTGELQQIHVLTESIGFRFQRVGADFLHPVVLVIVSPEGKIIRYLHGTHIVPKDLTLALYEAQAGRVGSTIRKVVQYCFSFDPEQKTYVLNLLRISATVILLTLGAFVAFLFLTGKKTRKNDHT